MTDSKKRNSTARIPPRCEPLQGVGGRQDRDPPRRGGGGYLDICTISGLPLGRARADSRVDELREMGLSPVWRQVAERVGYETFLVVWQVLDQASKESQNWNYKGCIRLNMPSFKRFLKRQRNLWIQQLAAEGYTGQQIQSLLWGKLRIELSLTSIDRIARRGVNE